jgi:AraC-like DNA-binding protein
MPDDDRNLIFNFNIIMMIWAILFSISIAQGIFLITMIISKRSKNPLAALLISAIVCVMIFTNLGYLVIRTNWVNYVPQLWGIQFGMSLLLGPSFYFYCKSIADQDFRWKKIYWLHFVPYLIQLLINLPMLLAPNEFLLSYIQRFLAGHATMRWVEKITVAVQILQFLTYLVICFRWITRAKEKYRHSSFIVSMDTRIRWVTQLAYCFSLYCLTMFFVYVFILVNGRYNPITNYIYTITTCVIIYFMAFRMAGNPELINPGFRKKYQSYMAFTGDEGEIYLEKLRQLMDQAMLFTDPGLKLSALAKKLGLPSHQVSKLINEKFGKTFHDYVNEYRVKEFISRINQDKNKPYSIYGLALDVGFNSKSSFNAAFKKFTGRVPSDYRPPV